MAFVYTWDPTKNASNVRDHGIDFIVVERFDWDSAIVEVDDREDYGELREIAKGFIGDVLHVVVFTVRHHAVYHLISLRKATKRERKEYGQGT